MYLSNILVISVNGSNVRTCRKIMPIYKRDKFVLEVSIKTNSESIFADLDNRGK